MSLKESHVARGVDMVSFSFSPDSNSRNQRFREISLIFFSSIDRYQSLHGEAQEKARDGKVRTSINSVFVTLYWKCFGGVF